MYSTRIPKIKSFELANNRVMLGLSKADKSNMVKKITKTKGIQSLFDLANLRVISNPYLLITLCIHKQENIVYSTLLK